MTDNLLITLTGLFQKKKKYKWSYIKYLYLFEAYMYFHCIVVENSRSIYFIYHEKKNPRCPNNRLPIWFLKSNNSEDVKFVTSWELSHVASVTQIEKVCVWERECLLYVLLTRLDPTIFSYHQILNKTEYVYIAYWIKTKRNFSIQTFHFSYICKNWIYWFKKKLVKFFLHFEISHIQLKY